MTSRLFSKLTSCALVALLLLNPLGQVASANPHEELARLAEKFPVFFRGYSDKNEEAIAAGVRNHDPKMGGSKLFHSDARLTPLFKHLAAVIQCSNNPDLDQLGQDLTGILADTAQQTAAHYYVFCMRLARVSSTLNADEEALLTGSGFKYPYAHLKNHDPKDTLAIAFSKFVGKDGPDFDSFYHHCSTSFSDPGKLGGKFWNAHNTYQSINCLKLCEGPNDDKFGFFYLARCYAGGIHPVPVTVHSEQGSPLHGAITTPWGKMCHDFAHSEADTADHNGEQFANTIGNTYLPLTQPHWRPLSREDKARYGMELMLPHFREFALSIHTAYHDSIVAILDAALGHFGINSDTENLPPEFKAFSVAAFHVLHERPKYLHDSYKNDDLASILAAAAPSKMKPEAPQGAAQAAPTPLADVADLAEKDPAQVLEAPLDDDPFKTCPLTGKSELSSEQIIAIAEKLPLTSFSYTDYFSGESTIDPEEISTGEILPNKLFIDVIFTTFDGRKHVLRQPTRYSARLNLDHDFAILRPAAKVLGYTLPTIPNPVEYEGRPEEFSAAVEQCMTSLKEGNQRLTDHYRETAIMLSNLPGADGGPSIADKFSARYQEALATLKPHLPAFITDIVKDLMIGVGSTLASPAALPEGQPASEQPASEQLLTDVSAE